MIDRVTHGWNVRRLVGYLMGPGRHNEHTNPHVLAAWQSDPEALQPVRVGDGHFDFDPASLAALKDHLNAPAGVAGLPMSQPAEGDPALTKHGYVWHASLSIDGAVDGPLPDETWKQIAEDVMHATGIDPRDDDGGCRWVAVHHGHNERGNDHIHIAAVLVRQDTGRRFYPSNDYVKARRVMRKWEDKLGLRKTAEPDQAAAREPSRAELEKSARRRASGMPAAERTNPAESVRGQLRQAVADTAAITGDEAGFLSGLRERGVLVHLHRDRAGAVDGYAVALPGDVDGKGVPIFYGAGKHLSKDLGWSHLKNEWSRHGGTIPERPDRVTIDLTANAFARAHAHVVRASQALPTATAVEGRDIVVAAHRMVAAYSRVTDGPVPGPDAPRTQAVWSSHRCAASARLRSSTAPVSPIADGLNTAARDLMMLRFVGPGRAAGSASMELMVALSMLMVEISEWSKQHNDQPSYRAAATTSQRLGRPDAATAAPHTRTGKAPAAAAPTPTIGTTRRPLPRASTDRPRSPITPTHRYPKGPQR